MNELSFAAKKVLVVGGSSGIGNGIAQSFRARGASVHVWGTRHAVSDYAEITGSDLNGLEYTCVDVSNSDAVRSFVAPFDTLDVLVLCQGTLVFEPSEYEPTGWDRAIATNLNSVMYCAARFRGMLGRAQGSIIIVSSIGGFQSYVLNPGYCAGKAGAISLTKTLGRVWASENIRVNGIAPGLVDTKLTKQITESPEILAAFLRAIPVARPGLPQDIANAALFLASPMASYICGHTIIVDGGLSLTTLT